MSLKHLQITAPLAAEKTLRRLARENGAIAFHKACEIEDGHGVYTILSTSAKRQELVDALYGVLSSSSQSRIVLMGVEATIPEVPSGKISETREELLVRLNAGADLTVNYLVLALLSTIVALIGLLQDNVAVVVGAMVIAPLLGPNLGLAFGTAVGDRRLIFKSVKTAIAGLFPAILLSALVGQAWGDIPVSGELLDRTNVGPASVLLAAASGLAGVLSVTSGLSMTLVGVMVAVALLPPATTFGFMLGAGDLSLAAGALKLLIVNIVSVNFVGLFVFLIKGFAPREAFRKRIATAYIWSGLVFWGISLVFMLWHLTI